MSDWNWTWLALAGIYFWYISYLPYIRSRVYFKGVSCYPRQTSIHWEVIPGQCVWPVDTNQWVEINPSAGSTGCTIKDHHYAAINTTVILCNYEDKSVNNPGEIYDCIFTINFFDDPSSSNPSFVSFYLQDALNGRVDSIEDVFLFSRPVMLWPGQQLFGSQRCPTRGLNQIRELLCFRYHRCCLNASSITFYLMFFDFPGSIAKHILATLNPWSLTLRLSGTITHEHHCA